MTPTNGTRLQSTTAPAPVLLPQSTEAEDAALGGALIDEAARDVVLQKIDSAAAFMSPENRQVFAVLQRLRDEEKPADLITFRDACERWNINLDAVSTATDLANATPSAANAAYHADIVVTKHRLREIHKVCERTMRKACERDADPAVICTEIGEVFEKQGAAAEAPTYMSVRDLAGAYPELRPPIMHGLLREGETMNVIAPSKTGKSWMTVDLGLHVATGRSWLGLFRTEPGPVLILDNELHPESSAHRIPKVAEARNIPLNEIADRLYVDNLRGRLRDLISLGPYFAKIRPRQFKLIILDAFYRFLPADTDENSNGGVAQLYNLIDAYAKRLQCAFVCIHHTSKGNQSGKTVTDVGSGAGAQSRAADAHLVLRQHEQDGAVVLDAAVRSWPPIRPVCLRWNFPVFDLADDLDPADLKPDRPRRKPKEKPAADSKTPAEPAWDAARFATAFITEEPRMKDAILDAASRDGLSKAEAKRLLNVAIDGGLVFPWRRGAAQAVRYATTEQPLTDVPASRRGKA